MIIVGIILSVFAIGFFCWLLFTLAVYALPVFVGLAAGFAVYHHGYSVGGAVVVALAAGGATLVIGQVVLSVTRTPLLRAGIALAFAMPAGIAGYHASLGIAHLCLDPGALSTSLAATGAALVFGTAWMRMTVCGPPVQALAKEQITPAMRLRPGPDRSPDFGLARLQRRSRAGR